MLSAPPLASLRAPDNNPLRCTEVMTSNLTLAELQLEVARKREIAIPIAGATCWAVAGGFGAVLAVNSASVAMFICVGMIFPLSLRTISEPSPGNGV